MKQIDLSVCIVNWNAGTFLVDCLRSILCHPVRLRYEIIVVDNASSDDSIAEVRSRFPEVRVILRDKNCGFAAANNIAITESRGKYLLLLNPDTIVMPNALENMVRFLESHPRVGILGCRLFHPETGVTESSARSFPKLLPLLWNLSYIDRLFKHNRIFDSYTMTSKRHVKPYEVDWVTGACLMARSRAIEQVGLLDENIFMYCEDIDWCYRFKKSNWSVYYLPKVSVAHYRGQSSKLMTPEGTQRHSVWGARQFTRSLRYFYRKHYGAVRFHLLSLIILMTSLLKALIWSVFGTVRYGRRVGSWRARCYLSMIPAAFERPQPSKLNIIS